VQPTVNQQHQQHQSTATNTTNTKGYTKQQLEGQQITLLTWQQYHKRPAAPALTNQHQQTSTSVN
jgi:hypothetical protein